MSQDQGIQMYVNHVELSWSSSPTPRFSRHATTLERINDIACTRSATTAGSAAPFDITAPKPWSQGVLGRTTRNRSSTAPARRLYQRTARPPDDFARRRGSL